MSATILVSAGDPSGEMHAARLVAELQERTGAAFFGLGGRHMAEAGVELVADLSAVSVVGITEVIRRLPAVWRLYRRLVAESARRQPQLAILVDFPEFNLRLARRLHRQGVRAVYFISPQVWAWRRGRVELMKRLVERVLCIFPFEENFYRQAGVPATYVGHPLVDLVRPRQTRAEFLARHALPADQPVVALLPGSRPSEVEHNLPPMLAALPLLRRHGPYQFVLAGAPGLSRRLFKPALQCGAPVKVVYDSTYDALVAAECAIISSGTATVEAALLGTPMVVVYRLSPATAFLARRLVRTPYFSMVNLIAERRIVPELFQNEFTGTAVAREAHRLLASTEARAQMLSDLAEVRRRLGAGGAIERAAEIIAGLLAPVHATPSR